MTTRKKLGRNVLGEICKFLHYFDDADVREEWPEAADHWLREAQTRHVLQNGTIQYKVHGILHRDGKPAEIKEFSQLYFDEGELYCMEEMSVKKNRRRKSVYEENMVSEQRYI